MDHDLKYAQYTGALTAMTRFLVDDLERAISMLDEDEHKYRIDRFQMTVDHAKQVLIDVKEKRDFSQSSPTGANENDS